MNSHDPTSPFSWKVLDDVPCNAAGNPPLPAAPDPLRRDLLKGGIGVALLGFFGSSVAACVAARSNAPLQGLLGFTGIEPQTDPAFDRIVIAPGYQARAFFSWGDPVLPGAPVWQPDAADDWRAQLQQAGDNHDGMHYFPFPDAPNDHGLLVINHEFVSATLHPQGMTRVDGKRPLAEVKKEQAAHGVSVIEVRKDVAGHWQRVSDSRFNRRLSALTPMAIGGPLAGHDLMKSASDPEGRTVLGTIANCAMGFTPWGTYLICEENWHLYFVNRDAADHARRVSHWRYGISSADGSRVYGWETADLRFDVTPQSGQPFGGHVQEPHRFGWVVEFDPFDPDCVPVKRTALGRFCREGASVAQGPDGRLAIYSGDDTKGEYIYKFVPSGRYNPDDPAANRHLLDSGTLYVAQFRAGGEGEWKEGEWKALVFGQNGLVPANGFSSQEEILLNTRAAADQAGATPMDRPEWVAVHPQTREVYVTCTNNDERGSTDPVDAANPRPRNLHGQILRWREAGADPTATRFQWDIFLLAGEPAGAKDSEGKPVDDNQVGTIRGDLFSSPDGLAFDSAGRLWIETDYDDRAEQNRHMGCNQLLCADPVSREVRRFLVGPRGCEITGITWTPDYRAMWINVQHPGLSFPASDGKSRPRSTTVLITKNDGGVIGT